MTNQPNPQEPVAVTPESLITTGHMRAMANALESGAPNAAVYLREAARRLDDTTRIAHAPSQLPAGDDEYGNDVERLRINLATRDSWIVSRGLWSEFVAQLPSTTAIPAQGFCPTCGKPSDSDCSKCAQWWKDNPPTSQHSELADIVKQARADYDLLHVAGMASAHWIERHAMKLINLAEQSIPDTVRRDAWERGIQEAAKVARDIGISIDQISAWQNLSKLQFGNEVAQHISSEIRALANKGIENV